MFTNGAIAEDAQSPWTLSGHVGATSNYVSRGLTQTWGGPAAQAEIEIEHDSGLYAGAFASNVSRNQFPGGNAEIEAWTGYEREVADDASVAAEAAYYAYPGANFSKGNCAPLPQCPAQTFDTLLGALVARWHGVSTRFGYAFTDYFGDSQQTGYRSGTRGTWYWEAEAQYPLPIDDRWQLLAHAGYTRYSAPFAVPKPGGATDPSYWDWRLGAARRFGDGPGGWRLGAYYTQASNRAFYDQTRSLTGDGTKNLGAPSFIVEVEWRF